MAITNTTTQASIVTAEFISAARVAARGASMFAPGGPGRTITGIVDVVNMKGKGSTVNSWPISNYYAAVNIAEGDNATASQAYTPTDNVATVSEIVAIETMTRLSMETAAEASIARASRMLGVAIGEKIDTDILALNTSLDSDSGSSAAAATYTLLTGAIRTLDTARYTGPYNAILHPYQYHNLVNQGTSTLSQASGVVADDFVTNYTRYNNIGGMSSLLVSARVPNDAGAINHSGAIFSSWPAYGLAELWWGDVEQERDASARATEIVITSCYGIVEIDGDAAEAFETGVAS